MYETKKFTIECEMKERWIPHFLGMLKTMQQLGNLGSSRNVSIFSDGDGDFRPKFQWKSELPEPAHPLKKEMSGKSPRNDGYLFDAG